jgi:hypothetical protein
MSAENKTAPDGYVAWHPKLGVDVYNGENVSGGKYSYTEVYQTEHMVEKYADPMRINQQGWKARPVKLQFLDEPKQVCFYCDCDRCKQARYDLDKTLMAENKKTND